MLRLVGGIVVYGFAIYGFYNWSKNINEALSDNKNNS